MKSNNKRVVGTVIAAAQVRATPDEANTPDSNRNETRKAFAQLGQALAAFGPFDLGEMAFVEAGIELDILDTSKGQGANYDQLAFETFVRRAHDICLDALHAQGETSEQLAGAAHAFAVEDDRNVHAIKALFTSIATQPGAVIISKDGELIDLGMDSQTEDDEDADMEIEVARIRKVVRVKTTQGQYDVPAELAEDLKVGQHVCLDGVEPPTGAACVRAESIDTGTDPTGELFADSAISESANNPDHTE